MWGRKPRAGAREAEAVAVATVGALPEVGPTGAEA